MTDLVCPPCSAEPHGWCADPSCACACQELDLCDLLTECATTADTEERGPADYLTWLYGPCGDVGACLGHKACAACVAHTRRHYTNHVTLMRVETWTPMPVMS